jgi:hypothetical protein
MPRRLAPVAVIALLLFARVASAETGSPIEAAPPCASADPVLPATLPADVPGIPIRGPATAASLSALDGTAIGTTLGAFTSGYTVLSLSASLVPGTVYTLRWSDECAASQTRTFTATASIPLPTSAGTLTAVLRDPAFYCENGEPTGVAWADLHLATSADLAPFAGVAAVDLLSDGSPSILYGVPYGGLLPSGGVGAIGMKCPYGARDFRVSARVRLPNGPSLTTGAVAVTLPCPTSCDGLLGGPTTPGIDAGTGTDSGAGAGVSAAATDDGPGCSTSPGVASGGWALVVSLGIALGGRWARRRRAR